MPKNVGTWEWTMPDIKPKILIVDDEENVRLSLATLLQEDYQIKEAGDAEEALQHFAKETFSVALMDIAMPGTSGEELLGMVKASWPSTEVIMITAVRDVDQAVRCLRMGAYDFLSKPFTSGQLRSLILRYFGEKTEDEMPAPNEEPFSEPIAEGAPDGIKIPSLA